VHAHCVLTKMFRILFGVLMQLTSADVGTGVSGLYTLSADGTSYANMSRKKSMDKGSFAIGGTRAVEQPWRTLALNQHSMLCMHFNLPSRQRAPKLPTAVLDSAVIAVSSLQVLISARTRQVHSSTHSTPHLAYGQGA
jgi:hypothetical protein